ncbi:CLUMA_CG011217, isoform A [Clunio marinus]|uniref:CLUMA_CG011217, isoform A n=1 Tax=Clunio marinus TaxID=568069 RepID=A0A1J1IHC1_9DIPT|nr:CLUMA_CG011217, isoform A [Clunio marinus]
MPLHLNKLTLRCLTKIFKVHQIQPDNICGVFLETSPAIVLNPSTMGNNATSANKKVDAAEKNQVKEEE